MEIEIGMMVIGYPTRGSASTGKVIRVYGSRAEVMVDEDAGITKKFFLKRIEVA